MKVRAGRQQCVIPVYVKGSMPKSPIKRISTNTERKVFDGTGHLNPRYSTWYPDENAGNSRTDGEIGVSLNGGFLNDRFTSAERDATVNSSKEARVEGYDGDPKEHCADYGFVGFTQGTLDLPPERRKSFHL